MPFYRSPDKKYRSVMPSYAEWDRLSGGADDNNIPLLQYINKRMYEHSIYARMVTQHGKMEAERLCCLIQIWYATRMYIKSYSKTGTFSRNMRSAIRADGFRKISLGDQGHVTRIEVIEALSSLVAQELMLMTGTANQDELKTKIKEAEVLQLTTDGRKADNATAKDGRLLRTYLSKNERSKYQVLLEGGVAKMHPRGPDADPLAWVAASTRGSNDNACYKDIGKLTLQSHNELDEESQGVWREFRTRILGWGLEGYVMTHSRKLFISNVHKGGDKAKDVDGFFHSAYTAGDGVVCSGSIAFENGKPVAITNLSGHYHPGPQQLDRVIRLFEMAGIPTSDLNILVNRDPERHHVYTSNGGRQIQQFRNDIRGSTHSRFMH